MRSAFISWFLNATTDWLSLIQTTPTISSTPTTVADDLEELKKTLVMIEAVLQDAEEREIHDRSVMLWLKEIKELAYDVEDLLDEYQYYVLQAQRVNRGRAAEASRKRKYADGEEEVIMSLASSSSSSASNIAAIKISILSSMADRIKNIRQRFDKISKDRHSLQLKSEDGQRRRNSSSEYPQPTSHMIIEYEIYGREDDREVLKDWLFSNKESKYEVLAVVGKGGLGKTTLAQLIYNDTNVSEYFQQKMWICVSDDFNLIKLTRAMIESITKASCTLSDQLSLLQESLQNGLQGKRVLLVLDDVWNDNKNLWKTLSNPFHYAEMIRIIVTTRNDSVAEIMQTTDPHRLGYLPGEQSWQLFLRHAFCDRDPELFPRLVDIGKKIMEKCDGLPLAVKSLGGLLQHETEEDRWKDVLESEVWKLDGETDILPALKLSYIRMPSHLKPCFAICSMFPKNYVFGKDELVKLWAAHGYIQYEVEEKMAYKYFDELHRRSFFDDDGQNSNQERIYKMHDNIHDLAHYVQLSSHQEQKVRHLFIKPGSLKFHLDAVGGLRTLIVSHENNDVVISEMLRRNIIHLRYLNIVLSCPKEFNFMLPEEIGNIICLRHLKLDIGGNVKLSEFIGNLYNLDVLEIRCRYGHVELPETLGNLISLRQLKLDIHEKMKLPKSIGALYNLAVLEINCWELDEPPETLGNLILPETLGNLISLRHLKLDIHGEMKLPKSIGALHNLAVLEIYCPGLVELPEGFRNLVSLTTIHFSGFSNEQLPVLGQIPSLKSLTLRGLENVKSIGNELYRGLNSCHRVAFPFLTSLVFEDMDNWEKWDELLEGDLPQLQKLEINSCGNLSSLPPLRNLHLLSHIRLKHCSSLRLSTEGPFPPNLKTLVNAGSRELCITQGFGELKKLERLCGKFSVRVEEVFGIVKKFGNLKCLSLSELHNAHSALLNARDCLQKYNVFEKLILYWFRSSPDHYSGEEDLHLVVERDERKGSHHSDSENASFSLLDNLQPHANLKELTIVDYDGDRYPSWICDPSFNKLTSIELKGSKIDQLPALGQLPRLKNLDLSSMSRMKRIGHEFCRGINQSLDVVAFPSLANLEFDDMYDWEEWSGFRLGDFPQLQRLSVRRCPKLTSLPDLQTFGVLLDLSIYKCPLMRLSLKTLEYLKCRSTTHVSLEGKLLNLERLTGYFSVRKDELFEVLKNFHIDTDFLIVTGLRNVCSNLEIGADVRSLYRLKRLLLDWRRSYYKNMARALQLDVEDGDFRFPSNETVKTSFFVLNKLQPHRELMSLGINGYLGVRYPSWVGHSSFHKLKDVLLDGCVVDQLPTLGQLPSLERLHLRSASGLTRIGDEFCRDINNDCHNVVAFPSLTSLEFHKMHDLIEWDGVRQGDFPNLRNLTIKGCPKVSSLPDVQNLGTELHFRIYACPAIQTSFQNILEFEKLMGAFEVRNDELFGIFNNLPVNTRDHLTIAALRNVRSIMAAEANLKRQHGLKNLTLQWSDYRYYFADIPDHLCLVVEGGDVTNQTDQESFFVLEKLQPHTNLQRLVIEGYDGVGYPSWIGHPSFDMLTVINLDGLKTDQLPTLGQLPSLESLHVKSNSHLKIIDNEFCRGTMMMNNQRGGEDEAAFPALKELYFIDMHAWKEWYGVLDRDFPLLRQLTIGGCPRLGRDLVCLPPRLLKLINWENSRVYFKAKGRRRT